MFSGLDFTLLPLVDSEGLDKSLNISEPACLPFFNGDHKTFFRFIKEYQHSWSNPSQEDPLEKEMATYSSILAWEIPRTEKSGEQ